MRNIESFVELGETAGPTLLPQEGCLESVIYYYMTEISGHFILIFLLDR